MVKVHERAVRPETAFKVFTTDDFPRPLKENRQYLEWLILQLDAHSALAQLAALKVNFEHPEPDDPALMDHR
jgi:hypothetical protein